MSTLADVALAAGLNEAETLCAPAVLDRFADGFGSPEAMARAILDAPKLREYFAEVCRKVASSPEGRKLYAEYKGAAR